MARKPCLDCAALTRNGSRCGPDENNCEARFNAARKAAGATGHVGRHIPSGARRAAIARQLGRCGRCGVSQEQLAKRRPPRAMEIHHRDSRPGNNELNNLVMLCPDCHHIVEDEIRRASVA